jgi:hypothetical protein
MAFSRSLLKNTTYLERAFLGFLALGTAWVYFAPAETEDKDFCLKGMKK